MSAFLYGIGLQFRMDARNRGILLTYYVVPLVFYAFMGGIFTSIDPAAKETLIQSMTIFGVTMGAYLGTPIPLTELYGSELRKAYRVGGIPLWTAALNNFLSGFLHLFAMSLILFLTAPLLFQAACPAGLPAYFLALALFLAVSLAVGTVLGLFAKSAAKLTMVSQFLFLPSIMLSGIMFPASMLPKPLALLGQLFPATWSHRLLCGDWAAVWPLAGFLVAALLLAVWRLHTLRKAS